jgi:hypothetical protein
VIAATSNSVTAINGSADTNTTETSTSAPNVWARDVQPEPENVTPAAYKLKVKTLKKACFGSAGCNVTVRISIGDVNADALNVAADLTFKVTGAEDAYVDTISIDEDGNYLAPEVDLSTSSAGAKIRARVTDVETS